MPLPWLVPAIAGIVSLVGSAISSRASRKQAQQTNTANLELSKYGYGQDKAMWEAQNRYNSPMAQMARFSEAGLNPNLVYGQGSAGNAASIPSFDVPKADLHHQILDIPSMLNQYQDFNLKQAQVDNINANTRNTNERTTNESLRRMLMELTGKKGSLELERMPEMQQYQADIMHGQADASYSKLLEQFARTRGAELQNLATEKSIKGIGYSNELKRLQIIYDQNRNQWIKMGFTSHDNVGFRVLIQMMTKLGLTPGDL